MDSGGLPPGADLHITRDELSVARKRINELKAALRPFVDACVKADESSKEMFRAGMGNGHSDSASCGWGVRYGHLKEARRVFNGDV